MNNNQPVNQAQMQVKISDEVAKGIYTNNILILHTQEEFVMDCMTIFNGSAMVSSRVIMSPGHFKRLVAAANENLKKYESQFGQIQMSAEPNNEIGFQTQA